MREKKGEKTQKTNKKQLMCSSNKQAKDALRSDVDGFVYTKENYRARGTAQKKN